MCGNRDRWISSTLLPQVVDKHYVVSASGFAASNQGRLLVAIAKDTSTIIYIATLKTTVRTRHCTLPRSVTSTEIWFPDSSSHSRISMIGGAFSPSSNSTTCCHTVKAGNGNDWAGVELVLLSLRAFWMAHFASFMTHGTCAPRAMYMCAHGVRAAEYGLLLGEGHVNATTKRTPKLVLPADWLESAVHHF